MSIFMDIGVIIFLFGHVSAGIIIGFIARGIFQKKMDDLKIYRKSLEVFFEWKNEIGGVSLKGVGAHYEKWIQKKIQNIRYGAGYNTNKEPRKNTD